MCFNRLVLESNIVTNIIENNFDVFTISMTLQIVLLLTAINISNCLPVADLTDVIGN